MDLIHRGKTILKGLKVAKNPFSLAQGLMFASKKKVKRGICLLMPQDLKFGASVTMWFCFFSYEILFVNSKHIVVDKIILKPWRMNYTPKEKCKYVFESLPGTFEEINIGDRVRIKE